MKKFTFLLMPQNEISALIPRISTNLERISSKLNLRKKFKFIKYKKFISIFEIQRSRPGAMLTISEQPTFLLSV